MSSQHEFQDRVFGTAELLEMVLYKLPLEDLSTVRLVSKDFQKAVDSSHTLTVRQFMKPLSESRSPKVFYWKTTTTETDSSAHFAPPADGALADPDESHRAIPVCTVHPRLKVCSADVSKTMLIRFPPLWKMMDFPAGGPWEELFLLQPPCKEITIEIPIQEATKPISATVRHGQGVCFGHIVAKLREIVEACNWRKDALAGGYGQPRFAQDRRVYGRVDGVVWEGSEWVSEAERNQTRVEADRLLTMMTDVFEEDDAKMELE